MAVEQILGTYSPESVVVVISNSNFAHTVNGYTDGSFINITRVIPHATRYVGADNSHARVVRAVTSADVTLTLHQSSESNDVLSRLLQRDEASRNGDDIFTITIKDASGRTVASSPQAYIGTVPDVGFGTEMTDREWVIMTVNMDTTIGGNAKMTESTYDTVTSLGSEVDDYWNPNA